MSISGINSGGNLGRRPSISGLESPRAAGISSPKLKLKDSTKTVAGEIIDVDYKSVSENASDSFASRDDKTKLAYGMYARVQNQREEIERDRKERTENKLQEEQKNWQTRSAETPETLVKREVDIDIAKKLEEIGARLTNIEQALGLNGGTKNFKPSPLPDTQPQKMASNPNSQYSKHVSDYSSLVKGIQELHNFKRNLGKA